jgi:hypothetical protein
MKKRGFGRAEYDLLFDGKTPKDTRRGKALEVAHQIRQFEIDLYWKRAAYFWAILAVAFAGYFSALKPGSEISAAFISDLGMAINLAWYLVNRGSARWQQNWEFHVDLLEDPITGPIYKTQFSNKIHRFWDLAGAYAFSPTRVNSIISIFTFLTWLPLHLIALERTFESPDLSRLEASLVLIGSAAAVIACGALLKFGRARARSNNKVLEFSVREFD